MPTKFNFKIGQFEQVMEFSADSQQLEAIRSEQARLQAREQELLAQITATEGEQLATQATLGTLQAETSLEGIDQRVQAILGAEKKLELLESRRRALDALLAATREQMKPLPDQLRGYEAAIKKEANTQAVEEHLPAFLEAQETYLEARAKLRELLAQPNHFNIQRLTDIDVYSSPNARTLTFRIEK